ncbi:electron transport complex subunit RsxA [Candidatus Woesearchaeota archaeon]|nr:electron transport complex subunit RsxA [Candidatus Woesearchaeota archaeon]
MNELLLLGLSMIFANNIVLTKFLGFHPLLGLSERRHTLGLSLAMIIFMTFSSVIAWLINFFILIPFEVEYLFIVAFVISIMFFAQLFHIFIEKYLFEWHRSFGRYLPVLTTNTAILGIVFFNLQEQFTLVQSIVAGFSAALGFSLALFIFSALKEKVDKLNIPKPFKGLPIALIIAAIISAAFIGVAP